MILVISHLAFNNTNNVGKTLSAIFQNYKKDELIQLYFNPTAPNIDTCKSWFRITDKDIVKSIFRKKAGVVHDFQDRQLLDIQFPKKSTITKTSSKLLFRDILWYLGRINWKKLTKWLDKHNPDAIFLAPGYNCYAYYFALKISRDRKIPIISFLMDDYYSEKKNNGILEKIRRFFLRSSISKTILHSKMVFACSEEMADDYCKIFNKHIDVLYTPLLGEGLDNPNLPSNNFNVKINETKKDKNLVFIYAGSLGLKRWEMLFKVGKILQSKYPLSKIKVYAHENYVEEISQLKSCPNIIYEGFLSADILNNEIKKADVILHVESFDTKLFTRIRYSISTKIPECLSSNKIFLAIGPSGQAGIEYLKRNKVSFVCTNEDCLEQTIDDLMINSKYEEFTFNSKALLKQNHTALKAREILEIAFSKESDEF